MLLVSLESGQRTGAPAQRRMTVDLAPRNFFVLDRASRSMSRDIKSLLWKSCETSLDTSNALPKS